MICTVRGIGIQGSPLAPQVDRSLSRAASRPLAERVDYDRLPAVTHSASGLRPEPVPEQQPGDRFRIADGAVDGPGDGLLPSDDPRLQGLVLFRPGGAGR